MLLFLCFKITMGFFYILNKKLPRHPYTLYGLENLFCAAMYLTYNFELQMVILDKTFQGFIYVTKLMIRWDDHNDFSNRARETGKLMASDANKILY
jgi:hypothetical protein